MCGIYFSLTRKAAHPPSEDLQELLRRRGPDSSVLRSQALSYGDCSGNDNNRSNLYLTRFASVLSLRGPAVAQPAEQDDESRTFLCWNGEAWRIDGELVDDWKPYRSDSERVLELLDEASRLDAVDGSPDDEDDDDDDDIPRVCRALASVQGPFAFVYFDALNDRVYYGRDFVGRRSLLVRHDADLLELASVGDGGVDWQEVESNGVHMVDLQACASCSDEALSHCTRVFPYDTLGKTLSFNMSLPGDSAPDPVIAPRSKALSELLAVLRGAIDLRVDRNIRFPPATARGQTPAAGARVAVLFSGGLDCTLIARLLHESVPAGQPIDLLNVAFQNPRVHASCGSVEQACESCPDRVTGRRTLGELRAVCPSRRWNFVAIDVPSGEYLAHRDAVRRLIRPHDTEMDLSIASALYFVARGAGRVTAEEGGGGGGGGGSGDTATVDATTAARVLFSGLGADELFAGYRRHEIAYRRRSVPGLLQELKLDFERLGSRNLGRDDRVISHWGREVRYPFLDEGGLMRWAVEAPVWHKCGFGLLGQEQQQRQRQKQQHWQQHDEVLSSQEALESAAPKYALRLAAVELGMSRVACEKKRAIQFGTRTAKMEVERGSKKIRGTDVLT